MSNRDLARALARYYLVQAADEAAHELSREWDAKQADWHERMAGNIARWVDNYNDNVEKIDKIDHNLDNLALRLARTRNPDQITKVQDWIARDEARKTELEDRNTALAKKVHDVTAKLQEGGNRPTYYRNTGFGHSHYITFGASKLHLTKREAQQREQAQAEAEAYRKANPVAPERPKSFLELLFGL